MSRARKDSKGRNLRNGESQRKDGRYVYKYIDPFGNQKFVYSWRLVETDRIPSGKRNDLSLREKEKAIQKDIVDGLLPNENLTVLDLVKKYVSTKKGVKYHTQVTYKWVINMLEKEEFGSKKIEKIKISDVKVWYIKLQNDGKCFGTIKTIKGIIKPAFQMAVNDDVIRKNPFDFKLVGVVVNDSKKRQALTEEQERKYLDFVKNDKHYSDYYDEIYILLNTGMRISEFAGLTKSDLDFGNMKIKVDHQLIRKSNMEYMVDATKTATGTRYIPMTKEVCDSFKRILAKRSNPKLEPFIDGKSGFLFLDRKGKPKVTLNFERVFNGIVDKYNKTHKIQLPKITPHVLRHTFCTRMANKGMNPKSLQYIMGHSDVGITLNLYSHVSFDDAKHELEKISK